MRRWSGRILVVLVVAAALTYVMDSIVLQTRIHGGSAQSVVVVNTSYVIHQKSGKLEYLYDNPEATSCVRSLFPHSGEPPCWWLTRHAVQQKEITAN